MNFDTNLRGLKRKLDSSSSTTTSKSPSNGYIIRKKMHSGQAGSYFTREPTSTSPSYTSSPPSSSLQPSSIASSIQRPTVTEVNNSNFNCNNLINTTTTSTISWQELPLAKIRQIVFNISMCKLTRYRQTADPDLVKSVLICNTLKRLQRELEKDGMRINFGLNGVSFVPATSSAMSITSPSADETTTTDSASSSSPTPKTESSTEASSSFSSSSSSSLDLSNGTSSTSKFEPSHSIDSGRLTPYPKSQIEMQSIPPYSSSSSSPSSSSSMINGSSYTSTEVTTNVSSDENSIVPNTTPLETPKLQQQQRLDELFADIDLSIYDVDILSPLTTSAKITPISAEDLIKCITDDSTSIVTSSTTVCSSSSSSSASSSSTSTSTTSSSTTSSTSATIIPSNGNTNCNPNLATASTSTSCATQSTASSSSSVFSKIFLTKKETIFLDDLPPAIS